MSLPFIEAVAVVLVVAGTIGLLAVAVVLYATLWKMRSR